MTERKSTHRRRVATASGIPPAVEAWFAGGSTPWDALLAPERVPAWWRAWLKDHPGAEPPRDSFINFEDQT